MLLPHSEQRRLQRGRSLYNVLEHIEDHAGRARAACATWSGPAATVIIIVPAFEFAMGPGGHRHRPRAAHKPGRPLATATTEAGLRVEKSPLRERPRPDRLLHGHQGLPADAEGGPDGQGVRRHPRCCPATKRRRAAGLASPLGQSVFAVARVPRWTRTTSLRRHLAPGPSRTGKGHDRRAPSARSRKRSGVVSPRSGTSGGSPPGPGVWNARLKPTYAELAPAPHAKAQGRRPRARRRRTGAGGRPRAGPPHRNPGSPQSLRTLNALPRSACLDTPAGSLVTEAGTSTSDPVPEAAAGSARPRLKQVTIETLRPGWETRPGHEARRSRRGRRRRGRTGAHRLAVVHVALGQGEDATVLRSSYGSGAIGRSRDIGMVLPGGRDFLRPLTPRRPAYRPPARFRSLIVALPAKPLTRRRLHPPSEAADDQPGLDARGRRQLRDVLGVAGEHDAAAGQGNIDHAGVDHVTRARLAAQDTGRAFASSTPTGTTSQLCRNRPSRTRRRASRRLAHHDGRRAGVAPPPRPGGG